MVEKEKIEEMVSELIRETPVSQLDELFDNLSGLIEEQKENATDTLKKIKELQKQLFQKLNECFDQQVKTLVEKGYPQIAGITEEEFLNLLSPLRHKILVYMNDLDNKDILLRDKEEMYKQKINREIPLLIVILDQLISYQKQMSMIEVAGKKGYVYGLITIDGNEMGTLTKIDGISGSPYIAFDVSRELCCNNKERMSWHIEVCLGWKGRSPLSVTEGIALLAQYPEMWKKMGDFKTPFSRFIHHSSGCVDVPTFTFHYDNTVIAMEFDARYTEGIPSCNHRY